MRESKYIAKKIFSYELLKNQQPIIHKEKPMRPPQPVMFNQEGTLIEGVSPPTEVSSLARPQSQLLSILDAPIDVPTEYTENSMEAIMKMEPPPYHSPPTYSNTLNMTPHHSDQYSTNILFANGSAISSDPFDTSYLGSQNQSPISQRYGPNIDHSPPLQNRPKGLTNNGAHGGAISKLTPLSNQLDTMVLNTMASMSPRNSMRNLSSSFNEQNKSNLTTSANNLAIYGNTRNQSNYSSELDLSSLMIAAPLAPNLDESLSGSMQVNLSSRTIDDSLGNLATSINNSMSTPPKRLDKSIYADLEKNIYKNEQNTVQNYANSSSHKENTVSTMPSQIFERRSNDQHSITDSMHLNKVQNTTQCSLKFNNQSKSINQELAQRSLASNVIGSAIYQNNVASKLQKQLNTEAANNALGYNHPNTSSSIKSTNQMINQIWLEQQTVDLSAGSNRNTKVDASNQHTLDIGNSGAGSSANSWQLPTNHNFVAFSNGPVSMINEAPRYDLYSSVAGDIYGSLAGDRYESVAGSVYGTIPFNSAVYGNASTLPSMQPALYDEVNFKKTMYTFTFLENVFLFKPLVFQSAR